MLHQSPPLAGRRRRTILALFGLLGVATLLPGRTITVDDSGGADFTKIQDAIDAAVAGDLVLVAPGTYLENLRLKSGVSVVGAGMDVTTVDGGALSAVALLTNCDSTTRLQGFTLTHGQQESGGGVSVQGGSPIITLNRITGNAAVRVRTVGSGGGIALQSTLAIVSYNEISGNSADFGGGVEILGGLPVITRNLITGNTAGTGGGLDANLDSASGAIINGNTLSANTASYGGGLELSGPGAPIVSNNLITGNSATLPGAYNSYGGGAESFYSNARLLNNTVVGNKAEVGGGIAISADTLDAPDLLNNIIYGNTGSVDSGGVDVFGSGSVIQYNVFNQNSRNDCGPLPDPCLDPTNLFVDPLFVDAKRADYRLLPSSPAIDSGTAQGAPADDLRGQRRPLDGNGDRIAVVDRGAYEFDRNDVLGLSFAPPSTLTWSAAIGASSYHVYSGALATLAARGTDTCRDADDPILSDLLFAETRSPAAGGGLAYVVTAVIGGAEQSPGFDSRGLERTLLFTCP